EEGRETHPIASGLGFVALFAFIGWFAHPIFGFLGSVFHGIASFIDAWPAFSIPLILATVSILGAVWFIRNFFESRRTPAGFGKLTDDDWFRVVFAGLLGITGAIVVFMLAGNVFNLPAGSEGDTATLAELGRTGLANLFDWFGDKFTFDTGAPLDFQRPEVVARGRFIQYGDAGLVITPAFFAIWIGVTLYTAAFIAEIVRGGILAVSKGQTEAAQAVGLRRSQYLRLIILPQAFRIIMPPMGNQYLNLFKNTSLGVAVGFPDIVSVGSTTFNQTGQSLPVLIIWQIFFLGGSLLISSIVNYYNRRLQLVER
ncbi:MAG: ABC transporter permease subunit, partial [Acidimicrobiia bacterium]|nr:ABC transporter permease subunit [Acidimicrobiia bacterium]